MNDRRLVSVVALTALISGGPVLAQDSAPQTLFTNVDVFDGTSDQLIANGQSAAAAGGGAFSLGSLADHRR